MANRDKLKVAIGKVININISSNNDWVFEIQDENGKLYYVLTTESYRKLKIRSPINKWVLDSLTIGTKVHIAYKQIQGRNLVIKFL